MLLTEVGIGFFWPKFYRIYIDERYGRTIGALGSNTEVHMPAASELQYHTPRYDIAMLQLPSGGGGDAAAGAGAHANLF